MSMNDPMREPIATITWCGLDVKQMYPEWSDEQCLEALDFVCGDLEDRSVEEGWNILDSLLQSYVEENDND